ncbi:MAG TPA: hypothetical protein VFN67_08370 [Polyangiales bacterium]|nr:hypothetical protein [Polyangiales bacterium]
MAADTHILWFLWMSGVKAVNNLGMAWGQPHRPEHRATTAAFDTSGEGGAL